MASPERSEAETDAAFETEYQKSNDRAILRRQLFPGAAAARFDRTTGRILLKMGEKLEVSFDPRDAQGLEDATPAQLEQIEISPSGLGIHFPLLDADIYLPALMEGLLGSRQWMAARMGTAGGSRRSAAKTSAARKNGRLGGRPKKKIAS